MDYMRKRIPKHFQKYASSCMWDREKPVDITIRQSLVRQRDWEKQVHCGRRLLTRTTVILEEVGQDPPFATTNMEERILGLAVCFSFRVPRPNSNLGEGIAPTEYQAILKHKQSVWEFNSILALASDYTGQALNSLLLPISHFRCQLQTPGCYLCFWSTCYRLQVPVTSALGSVNLLEQLTELRETFTFTRFFKGKIKDTIQQPDEARYTG